MTNKDIIYKRIATTMCPKQSSKEQQEEIRKPSSATNAKKQRKTTELKNQRPLQENRDTKGTFHAKMSSIKDRNGMDLTEAEHIKKRRQEYTEELYKKIFMTQIITMV